MTAARRGKGSGTLIQLAEDRWLIRVDHGRNPVTRKRQRVNVTFTGTRRDGQRKLNAMLRARDEGLAVAPDRITVAEWLPAWLDRHFAEGAITERIRDRYSGIILRHLVPPIGHVRLQLLLSTHIADLKSSWLKGGRDSTATKPLSPATVAKHLIVLSQALDEAVRFNIIPRNPAAAVSRPSVTRHTEQRALTEDEIGRLVATAADTRFDVPIRLALSTGLRQAEMLGLTWANIDFERRLISVPGTKTVNSRRQVELSPAMITMLQSHRQAQRELRLKLGPGWRDHGLVFLSSHGTPWGRRFFYRDYKALVDRSGIEDPKTLKWHTLRHTAASQWIRHGAEIFTVSRRLGHASASFTMDTYAHLLRGQQHVAAEALDHLLA